jgi:hypothetical protein
LPSQVPQDANVYVGVMLEDLYRDPAALLAQA